MNRATILALVGVVISAALLVATALEGCTLHHPVPVEPDYPPMLIGAALEKGCADACLNLRVLHCPEGAGDGCVRVCLRANELRPLPVACWADAGTASAARGCGALRCMP